MIRHKQALVVVLMCVVFSCGRKNATEKASRIPPFFSTYKLFDEPESRQIYDLKFYMLIVENSHFGGTHMISIRQDSNSIYGCNKAADFEQMPSLQMVIDFDSTTFQYSATHFKLFNKDIDTLRSWVNTFKISTLKDSVDSDHLDGGMKEVIIYDGKRSYHSYQAYGSKDELNPGLRTFIEKVKERYRR